MCTRTIQQKRVTVKHKSPNPLFEEWLTEWKDKAKENESKMQYTFAIALKSLRQYPLPLESGKECKMLKGFGDKLCQMLDKKLKEYKSSGGIVNIAQPASNALDLLPSRNKTGKAKSKKDKENINSPNKTDSPKKTPGKEYIPKHGSGAYAILVTLFEAVDVYNQNFMLKDEIMQKGQCLADTSFTKPNPDTKFYTAWSSMKNLLEKKLVTRQGNPAKFSLTEEGLALGEKLYIQHKIEEFEKQERDSEPVSSNNVDLTSFPSTSSSFSWKTSSSGAETKSKNSIKSFPSTSSTLTRKASETSNSSIGTKSKNTLKSFSSNSSTFSRKNSESTQSSTTHEPVVLSPNSFEIILLVDTQELAKGNPETDPLLIELKKLKVKFEVRNLKVGDYVWICRDSASNIELILPYIIERKRMDDLGSSIKDDRFHEQKFRLKQCGLKNLIYLVEQYGRNEFGGLPLTTLMQAATNTLIQDNFIVKFTDDLRGTCRYLADLSNILTNSFKDKTLISCPKDNIEDAVVDDDLVSLMYFNEFNKTSSKTRHFKVKEMFVRQLLQIKGVSVEKALAIADKYPTPKLLRSAYDGKDQAQGEKLLSTLSYGAMRKFVGPVISKTIFQYFCKDRY